MTPWLVLAPSSPGRLDGIGDQAWHLARALGQRGASAELVVRTTEPAGSIHDDVGNEAPVVHTVRSWRTLADGPWVDRTRTAAGVIVNFFPPAFVRSDLPALLGWLDRLGASGRPRILTLHELWSPAEGRIGRAMLGVIQRRVLALLSARVDHVIVTTALAERILRGAGLAMRQDVRVIPIGTNIDPIGEATTSAVPTLVMFGQPAAMHAPTLAALGRWLAATPRPVELCWLGRSAEEMQVLWSQSLQLPTDRVTFAAGLASADVSRRLASARVGLAPYIDGVSTRRSSVAALVAHRLPLVGLDGALTDSWLRESGAFLLSGLDEPAAFVANVDRLLDDEACRGELSAAAARLFEARLSWDRIADAYLATAGAAARSLQP